MKVKYQSVMYIERIDYFSTVSWWGVKLNFTFVRMGMFLWDGMICHNLSFPASRIASIPIKLVGKPTRKSHHVNVTTSLPCHSHTMLEHAASLIRRYLT